MIISGLGVPRGLGIAYLFAELPVRSLHDGEGAIEVVWQSKIFTLYLVMVQGGY
jgi:hypothetical protein